MDEGTKRALKEYGSLLAYLIPCTIIVIFVNIILFPRFERIAQEVGAEIPGPLRMMISAFRFFFDNFWVVGPIPLLPIVFAEVLSGFWRSNRGIFFGVLKWLFVFSTMVALTALVTSAFALIPFAIKP